jgi:hypothetical protein
MITDMDTLAEEIVRCWEEYLAELALDAEMDAYMALPYT